RAVKAAGDGDQVELRQRVLHAEIVIVVGQEFLGRLQRVAAALLLTLRRDDAYAHALGLAANRLHLARAEDDEITRHLRRARERDGLLAVPQRLLLLDGRVRDRHEAFGDGDVQAERGAEDRLIPAGEHAARVHRLHLRREHHALALIGLVLDVVESLRLLAN